MDIKEIEEKTHIDRLEAFAKEKGFPYYTNSSVKNHHLIQDERYTSTKFIVFDLDQIVENLFLVFYDAYSTKAFTQKSYCGLFKSISECDGEIKMIKRDWFDIFNFKKRLKTGDYYLDKHISIYSDLLEINRSVIDPKAIRDFVEINNKILALELSTICESNSIVPELNGKDLVALKTNSWIVDKAELTLFIEKGSKLLKRIK
ncbi:hypothetical protein [Ancylomarina longa]|uniref:Uncharacterized protein n=1 Tax=Ancylomarina longa TaxID=2487017 RepID=A0A434AZZ3_9BACT|nr:hypothetical protein [Ancylomarina longa]RUT80173.1 hypothetical protein DLK05_02145 [Ancylomarina longa]